jgi:drug/metabolite transporter (DMT)-like permease
MAAAPADREGAAPAQDPRPEPFSIQSGGGGVGGGAESASATARPPLLLSAASDPSVPASHAARWLAAVHPIADLALLAPFRWIWARGAAAVTCATFSFSLAVLFVKLLGRRVPVLEITLARSGLSLLATLLVARLRGHSLSSAETWGAPSLRPLLMLRGAIGCVAMVAYYLALVRLPMADAVLLFFANVPFTALVAWLVAGERLTGRAALGAAVAILGLVLVLHPPFLFGGHEDWGGQSERGLGVAAGLVSAALSAGAFLTIRAIGKREPALVVALYFHAATVLISAVPLLLFAFPEPPVLPSSLLDATLMAGVAAASFFGQLTLTRGFQLLPAGRASAINLLQVLFSTLWGWLAFGDVPTGVGFCGGVLIVAGALLCGGGGGGGGGSGGTAASSGGAQELQQQEAAKEEEDEEAERERRPLKAAARPGDEGDAGARIALTTTVSSGGVGGGPERSEDSKFLKQQQQQGVSWLAAREAAGAGVGSQVSFLLPRTQQEALAMSRAAAATLSGGGDGEDGSEGGGEGRVPTTSGRRRSSNAAG